MVRITRWLTLVLLLSVAGAAGVTGALLATATPAQAQFWGGGGGGGSGGFFGGGFGGGPRYYERRYERHYERAPRDRESSHHESQGDAAHAPPPRKEEAKSNVAPSTTVLVMGDGMADWLAYGLEDAFSDAPEVAIVRKDKAYSGLLRYDAKNDLDWWHVARDILAQEKPSYIVMMLGVTDRQNIRERDLAKEAEKEAKEQQAKEQERKAVEEKKAAEEKKPGEETPKTAKPADTQAKPEPQKTAEESKPKRVPTGNLEFRSDQWEKVYSRRIDETIAALKSKGVPVFWVGLPAIKGSKSTSDASYLNNLYRARAQRAGIVYIDVWDGFVDEGGRYTSYGPDYEGQERRLRSGDGVYFTKYGARKLAHYVEREIRRYMTNRIASLPSQSAAPATPGSGKPSERPLVGPVVPLAALPPNSDELIGSAANARVHGDSLAVQVLVKGEAIHSQPGRADDFAWPPGSQPKPAVAAPPTAPVSNSAKKPSAAAKPVPVAAVPPAATRAPPPDAGELAPAEPVAAVPANPEPVVSVANEPSAPVALANPEPEAAEPEPKKKPAAAKHVEKKPRPPQHAQTSRPPRPVQEQRRSGNPFSELFGVFR